MGVKAHVCASLARASALHARRLLLLLPCDCVPTRYPACSGLVPPSTMIRLSFGDGIAGRMAQTGARLWDGSAQTSQPMPVKSRVQVVATPLTAVGLLSPTGPGSHAASEACWLRDRPPMHQQRVE